MQTPICGICLKSDLLCSVCQERLEFGIIKQSEIEIIKFIYNLSKKVKSLRDIKILKTIDSEAIVIITAIGDAAKLVGKNGSVVKILAKEFNKPIRILEEASSFRRFVEELVSPTTVSAINTLYDDNKEIYRIRIPSSQKNRLFMSPENFSQIISDLYNMKTEIIFD